MFSISSVIALSVFIISGAMLIWFFNTIISNNKISGI
jgi:hypothetical protein